MAAGCLVGLLIVSLSVVSVLGTELFTLQDVDEMVQKSILRATASLTKQIQYLSEQHKKLTKQNLELSDQIDAMSATIKEHESAINQNKDGVNLIQSNLDKTDKMALNDEKATSKRLVLDGELDLQQSVVTLQQQVKALETSSGSGASYTRWGRTTCPGNGTDLVYTGYVGGSYYNQQGASNYVCLTSEPTWGYYVDGQQDSSDMYGAEYESYAYSSAQYGHFFGSDITNDDVPCAVCRSSRPTSIMIPGRNACYPGWTLEYSGYLMSDHHSHSATEFVCMDIRPEVEVHGHQDKNGALFYLTEANCGSLPCPPYVDGRELTCAVCSK